MIRNICIFLLALSIIAVLPLSAQQNERKKILPGKTTIAVNSVVIDSMRLTIDKAQLTDSYEGVNSYSSNSKDEMLLVVTVRLLSETSLDAFRELEKKCFVVTEKGLKIMVGRDEPAYRKGPGDSKFKFSGGLWMFSVPKSSRSFKLILPGNKTIKLDAFIRSSKKEI